MIFAWDENKNRINRRKHGVSFETAARVFEDPNVVSYRDRVVDEEERWHAVGCAGGIAILLVVHTSEEPHGEEEIRVTIDLKGKSSIGDYMVVTSGRSQRHVGAVADHVAKDIKAAGVPGVRVEGMRQGDWVLIDAGDVIVHVFRPEVRTFYNLEKMWSAGSTDRKRPN